MGIKWEGKCKKFRAHAPEHDEQAFKERYGQSLAGLQEALAVGCLKGNLANFLQPPLSRCDASRNSQIVAS
jgi:hypothetical protein